MTPKCGKCDACELERIGCGCDGALDDGCFLCHPEKHARPQCYDPRGGPDYGSSPLVRRCALCSSPAEIGGTLCGGHGGGSHDPLNAKCRANIAANSPVGIECEHGFDSCPVCDRCTCQSPGLGVLFAPRSGRETPARVPRSDDCPHCHKSMWMGRHNADGCQCKVPETTHTAPFSGDVEISYPTGRPGYYNRVETCEAQVRVKMGRRVDLFHFIEGLRFHLRCAEEALAKMDGEGSPEQQRMRRHFQGGK